MVVHLGPGWEGACRWTPTSVCSSIQRWGIQPDPTLHRIPMGHRVDPSVQKLEPTPRVEDQDWDRFFRTCPRQWNTYPIRLDAIQRDSRNVRKRPCGDLETSTKQDTFQSTACRTPIGTTNKGNAFVLFRSPFSPRSLESTLETGECCA